MDKTYKVRTYQMTVVEHLVTGENEADAICNALERKGMLVTQYDCPYDKIPGIRLDDLKPDTASRLEGISDDEYEYVPGLHSVEEC